MSSAVVRVARQTTPSILTRTFMLGIVGSLSMYLTSWENTDRAKDSMLDKSSEPGDTYDFIIVGGGTAGSVLSNRLASKYKTLLLEAGGEPHPFQAIPLLSNYLLNYAQLDWRHVTMPQKHAFRGSVQSRASISQGRGLGGTSNIDYMMYLRGHPKDYDNWAYITGDSSWSYTSMLKHFKSLEKYSGSWSKEHHGTSGDMKIRQPWYIGLGDTFCQAAQQIGYEETDLNGPFTEGCDILSYPTKKGYRDSAYSSFLKPAKDKWNLVLHKYAHVNKILIRGSENMAYGVEYDRHGKTRTAYAKKEIIIAAGAIQSPKLLLLSGIGPQDDLDSSNIPVRADLPVGSNLQDHLSVYLGPFSVDKGKSLNIDRDVSTRSVLALGSDGGPLTTTGYQAAAVISSGLEKLHSGRNWPDLQLTMYGLAHHKSSSADFSHAYQLRKELLEQYFANWNELDSFSILVSGGRPKSRGTVKLLNRNPYAPLIINPNYLDKVYDVVVMVDGLKKAIRMAENSTAFRDIGARFTREVLPGCEGFRFRSDAYWECYVRTMSVSLGNVAGTVPMGTVLNSKLQVKGVSGLRVIDASVMPSVTSTSTGAAVMAIAEKGASLILTEWESTGSKVGLPGLLKGANLVYDKVAEDTTTTAKPKLDADPMKMLLETLKLSSAESKLEPELEKLSLGDLQKLTQTMGSLVSLLGPLEGSSSNLKEAYTGSFDLDKNGTTATLDTLASLGPLGPVLKGQVGGLYKHLYRTVSTTLKPTTQAPEVSPDPTKPDPMKIIQQLLRDAKANKDLEDVSSKTPVKSTSVEFKKPEVKQPVNNVTLEDVFGMGGGVQDELEDYLLEEIAPIFKKLKTTTTTTRKPSRLTTTTTTTTTPTTTTSTTTTTRRPTETTTVKAPVMIEYPYEVISISQSELDALPAAVEPVVKPRPETPKPPLFKQDSIANTFSYTFPTTTFAPSFETPPPPPPDFQKFKNSDALAQIQHDTLSKLRLKQHQTPPPAHNFYRNQPSAPLDPAQFKQQFPLVFGLNNPAQYPYKYSTIPDSAQTFQNPSDYQGPSQSISPSSNHPVSVLPPQRGRFPPPRPQPPFHKSKPLHPIFGHLLKSSTRPGGYLRAYQQLPSLTAHYSEESNLRDAVSGIINAKNVPPPTKTPFLGMIDSLLGKTPKLSESVSDGGVLKALQLRSNVDRLLNFNKLFSRPSPISITTPDPSIVPPTPPDPSPASIFAPLTDALEPITKMVKAPFELISNPFKKEKSMVSRFLPDFFSQRTGPMEISESRLPARPQRPIPFQPHRHPPPQPYQPVSPQPLLRTHSHPTTRNTLSSVVPRFFTNQDNSPSASPELFIFSLANMTSDVPKPFVLAPSRPDTFRDSASLSSERIEERNKKQLDQSVSDILSHLRNHHFASVVSSNDHLIQASTPRSADSGSNRANEILHIGNGKSTPGKEAPIIIPAAPKVKPNPPIEFHKSIWAKEPTIPSKSLHFRIKIV